MKLANPNKRATEEWIGATLDTPFPDRVRLRIAERDGWVCQCGCGMPIVRARDKWATDHIVAIVNGGENRETNGRTLLEAHHKIKSAEDQAEKSRIYQKQRKNAGLGKPKGRPMMGTVASGWRIPFRGPPVRR